MLKYFVEDLEDHPQLKESLVALNLLASENDVIEMLRTNFVMELCADQFIDVYSEVEIRWFAAKILDVDHDNNTLRVHYVGWPSKYDENFFVSSKRICPINTFTPAKRKTPKPDVTKGPTTESVEMKPTHEMPENSLNERGSRRRSRSAVAFPADPGAVVKRRNTNGNGSTDPATAGEGKEDEKGEKEEKDHNDWVCTICGWFEAPDGSDLVCCDGKQASLHACRTYCRWSVSYRAYC